MRGVAERNTTALQTGAYWRTAEHTNKHTSKATKYAKKGYKIKIQVKQIESRMASLEQSDASDSLLCTDNERKLEQRRKITETKDTGRQG
jgi:hypothetical protein